MGDKIKTIVALLVGLALAFGVFVFSVRFLARHNNSGVEMETEPAPPIPPELETTLDVGDEEQLEATLDEQNTMDETTESSAEHTNIDDIEDTDNVKDTDTENKEDEQDVNSFSSETDVGENFADIDPLTGETMQDMFQSSEETTKSSTKTTSDFTEDEDDVDSSTIETPENEIKNDDAEESSSEDNTDDESDTDTPETSDEKDKASDTNLKPEDFIGFDNFNDTSLEKDSSNGHLIEQLVESKTYDPNRIGIFLGEELESMSHDARAYLLSKFDEEINLLDSLSFLPSATNGFTSNPNVSVINGLPNLSYSIVLREDLALFISHRLDALLDSAGSEFIGSDSLKGRDVDYEIINFDVTHQGSSSVASFKVNFDVVFITNANYEKVHNTLVIIADKEGGIRCTEKQS